MNVQINVLNDFVINFVKNTVLHIPGIMKNAIDGHLTPNEMVTRINSHDLHQCIKILAVFYALIYMCVCVCVRARARMGYRKNFKKTLKSKYIC